MSSTKGELVGAHEVLCTALWSRYFIVAQGYDVEQMILYQDNQATMRLEVNGRFSSTKWTKHINARYFFITDCIEQGDLMVQYCPTEMMWIDILNKPKQGALFRKDWAMLMNCPIDYDDVVKRTCTHLELLRFESKSGEPCADHIPQQRDNICHKSTN